MPQPSAGRVRRALRSTSTIDAASYFTVWINTGTGAHRTEFSGRPDGARRVPVNKRRLRSNFRPISAARVLDVGPFARSVGGSPEAGSGIPAVRTGQPITVGDRVAAARAARTKVDLRFLVSIRAPPTGGSWLASACWLKYAQYVCMPGAVQSRSSPHVPATSILQPDDFVPIRM
jgi:hypothetical protein